MSVRGRRPRPTRPDPSPGRPGTTTAAAPSPPPVELSAWLRDQLGRVTRNVRGHGLNPDSATGPVVLTPLGRTGAPGSREDRTCDRCRVYVPPGPPMRVLLVRAAPSLVVTTGLCSSCAAHEVDPSTLDEEGTP